MDTWKINTANKIHSIESESRECWQICMWKPQLTHPIAVRKTAFFEMWKPKKEKKIWVKYELYHISNLKDLGLTNEGPWSTTRGGATEAVKRGKCVSYTTFIFTEWKEWREGHRRGRLLITKDRNLRLEGTHQHRQMGNQTWKRQEGKTSVLKHEHWSP